MPLDFVTIQSVIGRAWMRDAQGQRIALRAGMRIPVDAHIEVAPGSSLLLRANDGDAATFWVFDDPLTIAPVETVMAQQPAPISVFSQQPWRDQWALDLQSTDPFDEQEATAAVLADEGHGIAHRFVRVANVQELVTPLALAYPAQTRAAWEDALTGNASQLGATNASITPSAPVQAVPPAVPETPIAPSQPEEEATPEAPSKPEDGEQPTEPVEPEPPVVPETPAKPDQPEEEAAPEAPSTPETGEQPAEPEQPLVPGVPAEPDQPEEEVAPETPSIPEAGEQPAEPVQPEQPVAPEAPTEPSQPEEEATPEAPSKPEDGEQPAEPVEPEPPVVPETPAKPDQPEEEAAPEAPSTPETGEQPAEPEQPLVPEVPAEPDQPEEEVAPETPSIPEAGEQPVEPEQPAVPEVPAEPQQPEEEATPEAPSTPEAGQPSAVPAPVMQMQIASRVVESTIAAPYDPLAGTTAVNGGAAAPSGLGFNLDASGNLVAIGSQVRVWGTATSKGPDGHTAINDFAQAILVYHNGEFQQAQFGQQLIRYGYSSDLPGNSPNANAPSSHAKLTDLFLLHSQSGVWMGNGSQPDGDYGSWQNFSNFTGNTTAKGQGAPDYAILIGDAAHGAHLNTPTNNNAATHINVLESLNIRTSTGAMVGQGLNQIEGVIAGGQLVAATAGHGQISQFTHLPPRTDLQLRETVYDVSISATVTNTDGSDMQLSSTLTITGVPTGAILVSNGQHLQAQADGSYAVPAQMAADGQSLRTEFTLHQAGSAGFTLSAQAHAHDAQDASRTATAHTSASALANDGLLHLFGSDADDVLLGNAQANHLHGGAGHDVLTGGAGDDWFIWSAQDVGTAAVPATDVVLDFGNGHDLLDVRDLLDTDSSLDNFIGATSSTHEGHTSTTLHIAPAGDLATGGASQHIVLSDVAMASEDSHAFIRDLIEQGKLLV